MERRGVLRGIARREGVRAPMEELERAEVTLERGVASDFRGRPGGRQVTLLSSEAWLEAVAELGETPSQLPWTARRANLLVEGLDLAESAGCRLVIGDEVELEVTGETDPCQRMNEQQPGLMPALQPDWRGGVTARVTHPGEVALGDVVKLVDDESVE